MILEKMPAGKLESLRAEVEAMIATKVAERRQELQSQLSKLLEISGSGNGSRSATRQDPERAGKVPQSRECLGGLVRTRAHAAVARRADQGRQRSGRVPNRLRTQRRKTVQPRPLIGAPPLVNGPASALAVRLWLRGGYHAAPWHVMAEQMTWRETMILAAISALLSAAITVALRVVTENATF